MRLIALGSAGGCATEQIAPQNSCLGKGLPSELAVFYRDLSSPVQRSWNPSSTLFTLWFGINDCNLLSSKDPDDPAVALILDAAMANIFESTLGALLLTGAQYFVLFNAPPMDRRPGLSPGRAYTNQTAQTVKLWNDRLNTELIAFSQRYSNPKVHLFDLWTVFGGLLDNATQLGFVDNSTYCNAYEQLLDTPVSQNYSDPSCSAPVRPKCTPI